MRESVSLTAERRLIIKEGLQRSGIRKSELARRVGVSPGAITKILSTQQTLSRNLAEAFINILALNPSSFFDQFELDLSNEYVLAAAAQLQSHLTALGKEIGIQQGRRFLCIVGVQVQSDTDKTYQRVFELRPSSSVSDTAA